jgi:hypothetical protein
MADEVPFTFDEPTARRMLRMLLAWEKERVAIPRRQRLFGGPVTSDVQIVRVTSTTPTGNLYPAKVQDYDADMDTWSDLGDCWARAVNDKTLAAQRYPARRSGPSDDEPVFQVLDTFGSGSGAGGSLEVQEVDGVPTISPTSILQFDQGDGFVVTDEGGGTARVNLPNGNKIGGKVDGTCVDSGVLTSQATYQTIFDVSGACFVYGAFTLKGHA